MFGRSEVMTVNDNCHRRLRAEMGLQHFYARETINSQGQVVGWYGNADGTFAAFLFTPEPRTVQEPAR